MPTRHDLFPSRWLKAPDVEMPTTATIARCVIETVGQGARAERKAVLYFEGALKPLVLNKTNFDAIVTFTGEDDSDRWAAAVVELFAIDVVGPNGPTRGIRVRRPTARPAPRSDPGSAAPTANDDISFVFGANVGDDR
jgi:hypothetical protein